MSDVKKESDALLKNKPKFIQQQEMIKNAIKKGDSLRNIEGLDEFEIIIDDSQEVLNVLTYSILMGNLSAVKYLIEDYKILIYTNFRLYKKSTEENECNIPLDPYFAVKMAFDT